MTLCFFQKPRVTRTGKLFCTDNGVSVQLCLITRNSPSCQKKVRVHGSHYWAEMCVFHIQFDRLGESPRSKSTFLCTRFHRFPRSTGNRTESRQYASLMSIA
ncbi:hypothetical protein L5515_003213 [Caenorhabditis briggsae]|uniref:Uncharacterized protein n=1 Tax=Caenorhabditis briggsae TaxID=6238 RepID=A0AAE9JAI9_CAEBR|nr:hypothetical protein L5515_003213 [Caenorhabditis briggsae]